MSRNQAGIDENAVKSLLAVSSVDGQSIVVLWADPVTHALLVKIVGGGGGSIISINGDTTAAQTLVAGSNVTITDNGGGSHTIAASGGSGSPGGSNNQVQYNNSGSFGGVTSTNQNSSHFLRGDLSWQSVENPLTFSTGLTRSTNTITANLSTGVSGGQSVIGGTAASDILILSSTTNGTKGQIIFGISSYDEAANQLGVGAAPSISGIPLQVIVDTSTNNAAEFTRLDNGNSFGMGVNPDMYGGQAFLQGYNRGGGNYVRIDIYGSEMHFNNPALFNEEFIIDTSGRLQNPTMPSSDPADSSGSFFYTDAATAITNNYNVLCRGS